MKEKEDRVFLCRSWINRLSCLVFLILALPDAVAVFRVYRGLGEVVWGRLGWVALMLLASAASFSYLRTRWIRVGEFGMERGRFLRTPLFIEWSRVTEAREGKGGPARRCLVLKSETGDTVVTMPESGEKLYEWLCSLVKERLNEFRPDVLDRDGAFPAVDGKVLMRRSWMYMVSWSVLGSLLVSQAYGFTRVQVPGRQDMGIILYCGIRHDRDREKSRGYLDPEDFDFLDRMRKAPELPEETCRFFRYAGRKDKIRCLFGALKRGSLLEKACGYLDEETLGFLHQSLVQQGRSSLPSTVWKDREYYLVGCLKAGGFLGGVPGTAEEWLHRGRLYRNPRMMLQRMEE